MKIDFHVHVTPPDIIKDWKKICDRESYFRLLSESPVNKFATAEDIVAELDNSGVDKAVIFGFAFRIWGCAGMLSIMWQMLSKDFRTNLYDI